MCKKGKHITINCSSLFLILMTIVITTMFTCFHQPNYDSDSGVNYVIQRHVDYKGLMSDLTKAKVAQDDEKLIKLLRDFYIQPPATVPYNLSIQTRKNPSPGQTQIVDKLLNNMRNGFFVECGAFDGETLSNSLFLERFRNWTGILIEPIPDMFEMLRRKNRKAYTLNACLSRKPYPSSDVFFVRGPDTSGKIAKPSGKMKYDRGHYKQVQCFPLYSALLALNQRYVDYFSLDIEGAELDVLETLPWDKIHIETFSIEFNKWHGGKPNLKAYMRDKGYDFMKETNMRGAPDLIFQKTKIKKMNDSTARQ